MKLKQITLRTVRLPLIRPYALSYRTFNEFEPIIVEAGISTLRDRVCMTPDRSKPKGRLGHARLNSHRA
jgi:hypothetical protein